MGKGGCCTPDGMLLVCGLILDWQREVIPDHKFDFVNVDDFIENGFFAKLRYAWVFVLTLKSVLVYMADIGVLVINLANLNQLQRLLNANGDCELPENKDLKDMFGTTLCQSSSSIIKISVPARLGIIFGSIFLSFVLLFIEWRKAQKIIKSRDISYAFTSVVAYRYYVIQSYPHFCFFSKIQNSRRTVDILAFFVFFRFKGWKKLLFAEMPRNAIYALLLIEGIGNVYEKSKDSPFARPFTSMVTFYSNQAKQSNQMILAQYILMSFTVLIWVISFLALLVAFFIYIPLLSKIRGNLKEYCCHKIDKRIAQILRKKSKKRKDETQQQDDGTTEYGGSAAGNRSAHSPLGMMMTVDPTESGYGQPVNALYLPYPHPSSTFHYRSEHSSEKGSDSGTLKSENRPYYWQQPYHVASSIPMAAAPRAHASVGNIIDHYGYPSLIPATPHPLASSHRASDQSGSSDSLIPGLSPSGTPPPLQQDPLNPPGVQLLYPGHPGHPYPIKVNKRQL